MASEMCRTCGKEHEAPFTEEVLALARRVSELEPGPERDTLVLELVDLYSDQTDWVNLHLPEDLHSLIEEYLSLKAQVAAAGFRLGRFVLRAIGSYRQHVDAEKEQRTEDGPAVNARSPAKKDVGLN